MAVFAHELSDRVDTLRRNSIDRDARMRAMMLVRTGHAEQVFKGLFPSEWPKAVIANTIDLSATDTAQMVGVLPTLTAAGDSLLDESKRSSLDKLSRIINVHAYQSDLGGQLVKAADRMVTYGFVPFRVEPNYDEKRPAIVVEDSLNSYFEKDRFGRVQVFAKVTRKRVSELVWLFPEHRSLLEKKTGYSDSGTDELLDVVRYHDAERTVLFVPKRNDLVLSSMPNSIERVPVAIAAIPSLDGEVRGQFDDSLWVYAAKARLALLNLEAAQKAVEAPLALPNDVQEFAFGPDAILRSNSPEKIRRVPVDLPSGSVLEAGVLDEELKKSTRMPDARTGDIDNSVVTGRGVQALLGGFDSRIKVAQSVLGGALADALSLSLEMDKTMFGSESKKVFASVNGTAFELAYTPERDIKNYHVNTEYGVMAGLDPNRALVWSLQALGAGLISESFVRRNLPVNLNATEEEKLIDVEKLRNATMQSVQSYAQAIPELASQGQDVSNVIRQISEVIEARKKGVPIEEGVAKAFAPQEPETPPGLEAPAPDALGPEQMMQGVPPAGGPNVDLPNQPPDMQQMLASLGQGSQPQMSVRTMRQQLV